MPLSAEQIDKVRGALQTSGWQEVMKPGLRSRANFAIKSLVLSRAERAREFKGTDFDTEDDVLRAIIQQCEWMMSVWDNEVRVAEHNRRNDELDRQVSNAQGANHS